MLVTIIIPTYERAGFVETAIESVLTQNHPEIELIVLDDGSTDETPAILERIAERADPERFRWARHDNVGQARTINRGLEMARGELLGYLSSDDYLLPGAVARLVEVATAHPDADVVYPWCDVVDGADRVIDTLEYFEHTLVDALRWNACLVGSGALVRRRYYERIGGWNPDVGLLPDFDWWLRGGEARFVCVPESLAVWRAHDGSLTSTGSAVERTRQQLRVLDDVFARDDLPEDVAAIRRQAYGTMLIANGASLLSPDEDDPRFEIYDRATKHWSVLSRQGAEESVAWLNGQVRKAEHQVRALEVIADQQHHTIEALRRSADEDAERIAQLEAALADARSTEHPVRRRPFWLRAGRRLTPPRLRHHVGVTVHRLRSGG
ncbi:MAG: glycosyltransferase [Patulibacter sp.]|nr:glycosyltransferase [Patulibacter sp.]